MDYHLVTTKLMRPVLPPQVVIRPRFDQRLASGSSRKLVLVSAPAGSGKSTLLASWLERQERPSAWLSLDGADNDPVRFLLYLIRALQQLDPSLGTELPEMLQSQRPVPFEPILARIVNDLARSDPSPILVLDDYHLITDAAVHAAVEFLLDHLPSGPCLILATRTDPVLALSRLRVGGELAEIRADQLRFSREETACFLNERLHLDLSPRAIASLEERTEGWIAGLQLAALSLEGRSDKERFVERFAGSHRYLVDYLMDEVLARQTPEDRRFLQRTSILERFTAPLCRAVSAEPDSAALLRRLGDANLFLIPLDDERTWYRYHHLFAAFLRHRLDEAEPALVPELHRRAGAWFEEHGWLDEAIHHALAAGDDDRAGHLVEEIAFGLENAFDNLQLVTYVSRFPLEMLARRPRLGIFYGWALVNTGRADLLAAALPVIERSAAHARQPRVVTACVSALRAYQRLWQQDFAGALALCRDALAVLEPVEAETATDEERWMLTAATNLIAYCHLHSDLAQADRAYPDALALSRRLGNAIGAANDFARHGLIKLKLGQARQALALLREGLRAYEGRPAEGGRAANVSELHLNLGRLLYEWNRLDEAADHLRAVEESNRRSRFLPVLVLEHGLAFRLHLAHGRLDAAVAVLGELDALLEEIHPDNPLHARFFGAVAQSLRLDLAATADGFSHLLAEVRGWVERHRLDPGDPLEYHAEGGYGVLARLLLAEERASDSLPLLERLLRTAEEGGRVRYQIRYLIDRALADRALGRVADAEAALRRALALAEPEEYVRSFVDRGTPMRALLARIARTAPSAYVAGLLAAFPDAGEGVGAATPQAAVRTAPSGSSEPLEPLSEREVTVLRLLAAGQSNKGIAKELGLSPNTVKWYLKGLFAKLGASGRLQAVGLARERDLL